MTPWSWSAFIAGFVFLLFVAGMGISRFVDRTQHDYAAERLEAAQWDCVESFVRSSTTEGERLRLVIEPADDMYIRQRVVETVYPVVDLTSSDSAPALRVVVRPGDDPDSELSRATALDRAVMNVLAAALLVLIPGFVPGLALTRSKSRSMLMAGVVCVVTAGVSGIACVLLRISVIPCSILLFVGLNAASVVLLRRWQRSASPHLQPTAGSDSIAVLLFVLCAIVLVVRAPEPVAWDARSIWWFHAVWFEGGGDVAVDAMRNPIMTFSHPDYPNGVPAFIGTVWALFGGENLRLAMEIHRPPDGNGGGAAVATIFDRSRIDSASVVVPILLGRGDRDAGRGPGGGRVRGRSLWELDRARIRRVHPRPWCLDGLRGSACGGDADQGGRALLRRPALAGDRPLGRTAWSLHAH